MARGVKCSDESFAAAHGAWKAARGQITVTRLAEIAGVSTGTAHAWLRLWRAPVDAPSVPQDSEQDAPAPEAPPTRRGAYTAPRDVLAAASPVELRAALSRHVGQLCAVLLEVAHDKGAGAGARLAAATKLLEFSGLSAAKRVEPPSPQAKHDRGRADLTAAQIEAAARAAGLE